MDSIGPVGPTGKGNGSCIVCVLVFGAFFVFFVFLRVLACVRPHPPSIREDWATLEVPYFTTGLPEISTNFF